MRARGTEAKNVLYSFRVTSTKGAKIWDYNASFDQIIHNWKSIVNNFPDEKTDSKMAVKLPYPCQVVGRVVWEV